MRSLFSVIFSILLTSTGYTLSASPIELKYLKIGTEWGGGYRLHKNYHGMDLSLNYAKLGGETWAGGKALYLFYPFYHSQHPFYLGVGSGLVHGRMDIEGSVPPQWNNGRGYSEIHKSKTYPTLEAFIGYEFFLQKRIKLFTQAELSVPLKSQFFPLFVKGPGESWRPGVSLGIGF